MNRYEFRNYIKSIGFKYNGHGYYVYKEYQIILYTDYYNYYNGSRWCYYELTDLTPLRKFDRSYKLKKILG